MAFYDKYVELCASAGKYPSKVAEEMGFSKSMVTCWKRRAGNPSAVTIQKICSYFGVPKSYFIDDPPPTVLTPAAQTLETAFLAVSAEERMNLAAWLISSLTEEQQAAFIQRIMFKK